MNDDRFFSRIEKELFTKPYWCNTKNRDHRLVWECCLDCNKLILEMVNYIDLDDIDILQIEEEFDESILKHIHLLSRDEQIGIAAYYHILLTTILELCEDQERYESCHNIKRFIDLYYTQTNYKLNKDE